MNSIKLSAAWFLYCILFLSVLLIFPLKGVVGDVNLPPLDFYVRSTFNALLASIGIIFLYIVRHANDIKISRWMSVCWVAALIALCATPPLFSGDIYEYLIRGRIIAVYQESPFNFFPEHIPDDLLMPHIIWKKMPMSYGALAGFFYTLPVFLAGDSIQGMLFVQKLINLLFYGISVIVFYALAIKISPSKAKQLALFYALNPFIVIFFILDGHVDIILIALLIAAALSLAYGKSGLSLFMWTNAFLIKYTSIVFLPVLIVAIVQQKRHALNKFPVLWLMKQTVFQYIWMVIISYPLWTGMADQLSLFAFAKEHAATLYSNSIPFLFLQAFKIIGIDWYPPHLAFVALIVYASFTIYLMIKTWSLRGRANSYLMRYLFLGGFGFCLYVSAPLNGWYLSWAFPFLILSGWPMQVLLAFLYGIAGILSYCKRINILLLLALFIYFAAIALKKWISPRRLDS